jgi:hypothetical protein
MRIGSLAPVGPPHLGSSDHSPLAHAFGRVRLEMDSTMTTDAGGTLVYKPICLDPPVLLDCQYQRLPQTLLLTLCLPGVIVRATYCCCFNHAGPQRLVASRSQNLRPRPPAPHGHLRIDSDRQFVSINSKRRRYIFDKSARLRRLHGAQDGNDAGKGIPARGVTECAYGCDGRKDRVGSAREDCA